MVVMTAAITEVSFLIILMMKQKCGEMPRSLEIMIKK